MSKKRRPLTDLEILHSYHKFVRTEEEDKKIDVQRLSDKDYGNLLAKKYYDKLYKEFAVIDLSQYESGKIGMRWRIEKEVVIGKAELICAEKKCGKIEDLETYEVNFAYLEGKEKKNTLVKVRVCEECGKKLNYKKIHKRLIDEKDNKEMLTSIVNQKTQI